MAKLFGSSGIRGVYGEKITPELALSVGKALGSYLKKGKILLARDTRLTSKLLENALAAGIESTGLQVVRTGVAPTPALAYSTKKLKMQSGAIVTASHNPPEYNGIKLWNSDSSAYTPEMEKEIEKIVYSGLDGFRASWEKIGQSENADVIDNYADAIASAAEISKKHNVALDCGHGTACVVSPELIARFGKVSMIFCEPDGNFPGRLSEPSEENLGGLKREVARTKAEVGIANDGDADRVAIVDEKGNFVQKDKLLALMALNELEKKKGMVVYPVDTSLLVEEVVTRAGGSVTMTPIGDVYVAAEMKRSGAVFGGEPCGAFIFPKVHWCPDGILASLKALEMLERTGKKMSELAAELPSYVTMRTKVACTENEKEKKCGEIYEKICSMKGAQRITDIDGVRADFTDSWVLARPSGTEPIIRITAEAKTKERADELLKKIR